MKCFLSQIRVNICVLITSDSHYTRCLNPRFFSYSHCYFSIRRNIYILIAGNFKVDYLRRTLCKLISEYDEEDKLSIKEFWRRKNIYMTLLHSFRFSVFDSRGDYHERNCRV
jgi:hypothetical protein